MFAFILQISFIGFVDGMKILKFNCFAPKLAQDVGPAISSCTWKPVYNITSGPSQRSQHAVCLCGQYVYLYGGRGVKGTQNDLWKFDIMTHEWAELKPTGDKLPPLEGHTMVEYSQKLYFFGGEMSFASANEVPLWVLDPQTDTLSKKFRSAVAPCRRREHVAVIYNGFMCIYGGYVDLKGPSKDLWLYNIERDIWEHIIEASMEPCPSARYKHAACVYQNFMWMCGGLFGVTDSSPLQVWLWDFDQYVWCQIRTKSAPSHLSSHALCVVGSDVTVFGGNRHDGASCSKLWKVNVEAASWFGTETWHLCDTPDKVRPSPSSSHCFIALPDLSKNKRNCTTAPAVSEAVRSGYTCSSLNCKPESGVYGNCADEYREQETQAEMVFKNYASDLNSSFDCTVQRSEECFTPSEKYSVSEDNCAEVCTDDRTLLLANAAHSETKFDDTGLVNFDALNSFSNGLWEMQTIRHFSYNLSVPTSTRKKMAGRSEKFCTTEFVSVQPSAGTTVTRSSNSAKVYDKIDLDKNAAEDELNHLTSAFLKNANVLNEAEDNLEALDCSSSGKESDFSSWSPSSLLLLGGRLADSSIHVDRPISLWKCHFS